MAPQRPRPARQGQAAKRIAPAARQLRRRAHAAALAQRHAGRHRPRCVCGGGRHLDSPHELGRPASHLRPPLAPAPLIPLPQAAPRPRAPAPAPAPRRAAAPPRRPRAAHPAAAAAPPPASPSPPQPPAPRLPALQTSSGGRTPLKYASPWGSNERRAALISRVRDAPSVEALVAAWAANRQLLGPAEVAVMFHQLARVADPTRLSVKSLEMSKVGGVRSACVWACGRGRVSGRGVSVRAGPTRQPVKSLEMSKVGRVATEILGFLSP